MEKLFYYLKGLVIVRYGYMAIKQLWPFLIVFIFWPEIDATCAKYIPMWAEYMGTVSGYIVTASETVRGLPIIGDIWNFLADAFDTIKGRLIDLLV